MCSSQIVSGAVVWPPVRGQLRTTLAERSWTEREGRKRSSLERLLGRRFPGQRSLPEVTPVPPKSHLAPVNSAVVFRQLPDTPSHCARAMK